MRPRTLAANILLPASIAVATITTWFWATGSTTMSIPTVAGLALAAAGLSVLAEWAIRQTAHAWRRRTRAAQRRAHARPNPNTRKAA